VKRRIRMGRAVVKRKFAQADLGCRGYLFGVFRDLQLSMT